MKDEGKDETHDLMDLHRLTQRLASAKNLRTFELALA